MVAYETMVIGKELILSEEKERLREGFTSHSIDHNTILISPEIERQIESSDSFNKLLTTALTEISYLLDKEIGKIGYIVEVSVVHDYEYPDWKENVIRIKVPIKDPKYVVDLWYRVGQEVGKKIESIDGYTEEIKRISDHTRISFRILE